MVCSNFQMLHGGIITIKSILGLYRYDDSTLFANLVLMSSNDNATLSNSTEITMVTDVYEQWIGDDEGELVMTLHGLQRVRRLLLTLMRVYTRTILKKAI